jgi:hypothetical protein
MMSKLTQIQFGVLANSFTKLRQNIMGIKERIKVEQ